MELAGSCSNADCQVLDDCIEGCAAKAECEFWQAESTQKKEPTPSAVMANRVPWHSGSLVARDVNLVSTSRRPHLVALIGPHDAGKTTYLAAIHLLCCRQKLTPSLNFAGSLTFLGWQRISDSMKYPKPDNPSPDYPPHTPDSADRTPGLLHYSFRDAIGKKREILFTDAPGEWFRQWAKNPESRPGAEWTVRHADSFLLFIDRDSISENPGSDEGAARNLIESIAGRLGEYSKGRPIGIVWTKTDISISSEIECSIKETLATEFPNASHFHTTVIPENGNSADVVVPLVESFDFAVSESTRDFDFEQLSEGLSNDRFLRYRGGSK